METVTRCESRNSDIEIPDPLNRVRFMGIDFGIASSLDLLAQINYTHIQVPKSMEVWGVLSMSQCLCLHLLSSPIFIRPRQVCVPVFVGVYMTTLSHVHILQ